MDNSNLNSPLTKSLQQSLYIAALDRYFGIRGLISPVTDHRHGVDYTFDFYHPQSGTLIKFITEPTAEQIDRDAEILTDDDVMVIIDASHQAVGICFNCDEPCLNTVPAEIPELAETIGAYVYFDDCLWQMDDPDDHQSWERMIPWERERCMRAIWHLDSQDEQSDETDEEEDDR